MVGELSEDFLDAMYDHALRTGEWSRALTHLRDFLSSAEVAFTVVDPSSEIPKIWETTGAVLTHRECDAYQRFFMHLDPKMPILAERGSGFLFNDVEHFDERFVSRDNF